MTSSAIRAAAVDRPALIRSGLFGATANLLAAASALYAPPLLAALWEGADDGSLLLLVAIALGLFAAYAALDFARARELARLVRPGTAPGLVPAGLDRVWGIEACWAPLHLTVLALLNPLLAVLALAGVSGVAAMIAVGAAAPSASSGSWSVHHPVLGTLFGDADRFLAGLRFCETVYRVLIVGLAAALLARGEIGLGVFVAAALVGMSAMRAAVRAAGHWHACRQAAAPRH